MGASHMEESLSPEEKRYREYMTTGDDFRKIEIYRSAAACYRKAGELKPGDLPANQKLNECIRMIKNENRIILIILSVAAVIIGLAVIFQF